MTTPARVSVVIPCWRAEATIRRAVSSVLQQTRRPDEIIVVDDGSPIPIASALDGLRDHVILLRQENQGAAAARNTGIAAASGDWVGFLDADDEWLPSRLERQLDIARSNPSVGFIAGQYLSHDLESTAERLVSPPTRFLDRPLHLNPVEAWEAVLFISTITVLARRDLLGPSPFPLAYRTAEDRAVWLGLFANTTAWIVPHPIAVQHVIAGSLSLIDPDDDYGNMIRLLTTVGSDLPPAARRRHLVDVYRRWAGVHLAAGRRRAARAPAQARLRLDLGSLEAWWIFARTLVP